MKVIYKSNKLAKTVVDLSAIKRYYGTRAKVVNQRISEFKSAASLEDIRQIPAANCHELTGDLNNFLAVDISGNHRIIFKPAHDPIPLKGDNGLYWMQVTEIIIHEIGEDYH
jgi:plasmid maintenance system killer protein